MDSSHNSSQTKDGSILPFKTIKRIMKSSPDMDFIAADSINSTTRATEMFISYITTQSYAKTKGAKELEYKHLANYVAQDDKLEFLVHIIPHKITVKKARELINKPDSSSEEEDDDEDNDAEESEEEAEGSENGNAKIDLTMSDGGDV